METYKNTSGTLRGETGYKNITITISEESLSVFQISESKKPIVVLSPGQRWGKEALRGGRNCTRLNGKPVADQETDLRFGF